MVKDTDESLDMVDPVEAFSHSTTDLFRSLPQDRRGVVPVALHRVGQFVVVYSRELYHSLVGAWVTDVSRFREKTHDSHQDALLRTRVYNRFYVSSYSRVVSFSTSTQLDHLTVSVRSCRAFRSKSVTLTEFLHSSLGVITPVAFRITARVQVLAVLTVRDVQG